MVESLPYIVCAPENKNRPIGLTNILDSIPKRIIDRTTSFIWIRIFQKKKQPNKQSKTGSSLTFGNNAHS